MVGKTTVPPFISQRYRGLDELDSRRKGIFPFDVPYYNKKTVHDLVELSKQYYLSDIAFLRLTRDAKFPKELLSKLEPLKRLRFFKDEILFELNARLGTVAFKLHGERVMRYCADFSKLPTPLWTWERAKAHLQTANTLLRRVSASDHLWNIWKIYEKAGKQMTETQVRKQIESHNLGVNLTPPMWMQHVSRDLKEPADILWYREIEKQGHSIGHLRQQHFKMMRENRIDQESL